MFGIAVAVAMGSYWLFHYGYYFAKGAPIALLDDILPSRRPTFLAAIFYMQSGLTSAEAAQVGGAAANAGNAAQSGKGPAVQGPVAGNGLPGNTNNPPGGPVNYGGTVYK